MPEQSTEDIDLLRLLERTISFFKKFKWVFIIALLAGIISGWFFYRFMIPVTYKSRVVLHSFILTNPEHIQLVNNWNNLLKQKEYKELSVVLGCNEEILRKTKQLKAKEIQQAFTPSNPNGFTIDAVVTDTQILDTLQAAIIYGFENGNYIRERLAIKRAALTELIEKTNTEIKKLDSTKKVMENIISGSGRASSSLIVDGSSINRQLIEMNEKFLNYKENLQFTGAVQVLQGFSKFNKPDGPHLLPWLIIGIFFFTVLAWAYALISNINYKLKQRAKK
ncbi:MAG: hypothetical protein HZB42_11985 [Sphingobacteriales bacterium]|nr:hypothetical protein [Sphingobacteriales bacterium]